jgi:hypothetical protein
MQNFTASKQKCDEYIGVMAIGKGRSCATFLEQLVPKKRVSQFWISALKF